MTDALQHFIASPDLPYRSGHLTRAYDGSTPFQVALVALDVYEDRDIQGVRFRSVPVMAAYVSGTWADVYAERLHFQPTAALRGASG